MLLPRDKDKVKNSSSPGYFRIGCVVLDIPPEDIQTSRVINNEEVMPLRSPFAMFVKTGQSRWDVTIRWTAMVNENEDGTLDYSQWEDLRYVIAMFKAAPFVEVYNDHLRQVFAALDPTKSSRLAFGLRQLRIQTHADMVQALTCELTMVLFNYQPYTVDFAYKDETGAPVSAHESQAFVEYLADWIDTNLDQPLDANDDIPGAFLCPESWREQDPSALGLRWRVYKVIGLDTGDTRIFAPEPAPAPPAPGTPTPTQILPNRDGCLTPDQLRVLAGNAGFAGHDLDIAVAVAMAESHGRIKAYNPEIKAGTPTGLGSYGLWQIYRKAHPEFASVDLYDPQLNANAAYQVYRAARNSFRPWSTYKNGAYKAHLTSTPSIGQQQQAEIASNLQQVLGRKDIPADLKNRISSQLDDIVKNNWQLDHFTEAHAFFFQELSIDMTNEERGASLLSLYPEGVVVLFVNNLAQLPLESYQYPTYQHIGPASTMVSVGLTSVGVYPADEFGQPQEDTEPQHPGIEVLDNMSHQLEDQYHRLRPTWRSVRSVHRMQAVRVYNQVLNMLGIFSLMPKGVSTATVPESANIVTANLTGAQYENVFEALEGYKVNGLSGAYQQLIVDDLLSGKLDAGVEDKSAIKPLVDFRNAYNTLSLDYLRSFLKKDTAFTAAMPVTLDGNEKAGIKAIAQSAQDTGGQWNNAYVFREVNGRGDFASFLWMDTYIREFSLSTIVDAGARVDGHRAVDAVWKKLNANSPAYNDKLRELYAQLMKWQMSNDSDFKRALTLVAQSPEVQKRLAAKTPTPANNNPAEHGAYRDMGFHDLDSDPGMYFVDYSEKMGTAIRQSVAQIAATATKTSTNVNLPNRPGTVPVHDTDPIIGDQNLFAKALKTPEYKMAAAFPTFKLFLMEEDNSGTFYAFDDFYSYASVTDIEIIRYRDKPDEAIIQITNLANLLSQRLFDDTARGKYEKGLYRFDRMISGTSTVGGPVRGPATSIDSPAGEDPNGRNYMKLMGRNLMEGCNSGSREVPLQYFPLQVGTKIEVRLGFSNNPDELVRVFGGTVAEIEGSDVMTIQAQGFMSELMVPSPDKLGHDTLSWSTGDSYVSFDSIVLFRKSPRFGGFKIWSDAGDAGSVIGKLLKSPSAKHFGHWQVAKPVNKALRGWAWQAKVGSILEALGSKVVGPILQASLDRSDENVLINHSINRDGSPSLNNRGARTYNEQQPLWQFWGAEYFVGEADKPVWDYIRDVSRRYPEYSLLVKPYGFPFGCDATLVFGHPRDFYYTRPQHFDETAMENKLDQQAADKFKEWWGAGGRRITYEAVRRADRAIPWLFIAGKAWADDVVSAIDTGGVTEFNRQIRKALDRSWSGFLSLALPHIFVNEGDFKQYLNELRRIWREWQGYRDTLLSRKHALLESVRKYHFVDAQSIVHNGIRLNEQIFNAVRINGIEHKANDNIPDPYIRVLDCDAMIVEPKKNCDFEGNRLSYAQSLLKEELGKMYQGELILRGMPSIEPGDVVLIADPANGMAGPVEVDKVIHSYNLETGYITIVFPRLYISINEAYAHDTVRTVANSFSNTLKIFGAGLDEFTKMDTLGQQVALGATGSVVGAAGIGYAAAGGLVAKAAAAVGMTGPPGWIGEITLGLLALGGLVYVEVRNARGNPVLISPLTRYGKPWIGGLEGYAITDFWKKLHNDWKRFDAYEIEPLLESYRQIQGYIQNTR